MFVARVVGSTVCFLGGIVGRVDISSTLDYVRLRLLQTGSLHKQDRFVILGSTASAGPASTLLCSTADDALAEARFERAVDRHSHEHATAMQLHCHNASLQRESARRLSAGGRTQNARYDVRRK